MQQVLEEQLAPLELLVRGDPKVCKEIQEILAILDQLDPLVCPDRTVVAALLALLVPKVLRVVLALQVPLEPLEQALPVVLGQLVLKVLRVILMVLLELLVLLDLLVLDLIPMEM